MTKTFLHGLALANFRGLGKEVLKIGPFQDINFFIGPNNVGKSTVLTFLSKYLSPALSKKGGQRWAREFDAIDVRLGRAVSEVRWGVGLQLKALDELKVDSERTKRQLERLLQEIAEDGLLWVFPTIDGRLLYPGEEAINRVKPLFTRDEWYRLFGILTGSGGGDLDAHWIPRVISSAVGQAHPSFPEVHMIPAIREVGPSGVAFEDFSGRGLIDKLAELQNPPHDQRASHAKFQQINGFLRAATGSEDALIEVPFDRRHLLVHMDGRVLPLSSLGTGIHEVIMLASFCTLVENEIICIEEPEIHLHPLLQKKFLRYLRDNTSNQYFIATHSASLIDSVNAAVFGVRRDAELNVVIERVVSTANRYEICREMGYRASDILQSNAVIWVEGPSDRIYIKHWISLLAPELVEGVDYSIMFYGGRLLSHLSADDSQVSEFIQLRRLNQNSMIVIDSDRVSGGSRLNDTKRRVVAEFGEDRAWVTAGREIENYVSVDVISAALQHIYAERFEGLLDAGRYSHRLWFRCKGREMVDVDKVKVARAVAEIGTRLDELDLRKRVSTLVRLIREAGR